MSSIEKVSMHGAGPIEVGPDSSSIYKSMSQIGKPFVIDGTPMRTPPRNGDPDDGDAEDRDTFWRDAVSMLNLAPPFRHMLIGMCDLDALTMVRAIYLPGADGGMWGLFSSIGLPHRPRLGRQAVSMVWINVDSMGRPRPIGEPLRSITETHTSVRPHPDEPDWASGRCYTIGDVPAAVERIGGASIIDALRVIDLFHCANITATPGELDRPARRRLARKAADIASVITINGNQIGQPGGTPSGEGVPLHTVRGHFTHYGDCCPGVHDPQGLHFGKHTRRIFIPQHARGSQEHGTRTHTYQTQEAH